MSAMLELKVVPQAGRQGFMQDKAGVIKCYLKSPPEDGKANKELIKLLSSTLDTPQKNIEIVRGLTDRKKTIRITSLEINNVLAKLGIEQQKSFLS